MEATHALHAQTPYHAVRVAVLGATGFVGRWVARSLTAQGAALALVVRDGARAARIASDYGLAGEIITADLCDPATARALVADLRPAVLFNLVGYGVDRAERDPTSAYAINAQLVAALAGAMARTAVIGWRGQRLIHVGSALEYGVQGGDLCEESLPLPTTLYGRSKLAGTEALSRCCISRRLRGLTARLFTVYGPGEHAGRLLPSLIAAARSGQPLALSAGQQRRDFAFVGDVAEGLLRLGLSAAPPGAVVNLATGELTSVRRFVEIAATQLAIPSDQLHFGALPTRAEEMAHDPVAIGRLRQLTGWRPPTTVAAGVALTAAMLDTLAERAVASAV